MSALQQRLLSWYADNRRDLPWRRTTDPYAVLVSEIMLQQTQVPRVAPRFVEWLEAWPTLESLAAAPLADVLQRWQGLGYNNRARRLQECAAAAVAAAPDGRRARPQLPRTLDGLRALPGIGPYTARAVLVFAHNDDLAAVDANVRRVLTHELGLPGDLTDARAPGGRRRGAAARPQPRLAQRAHGLRLAGADGARHRHRAAHAPDRVRGVAAAEASPPAAAPARRRPAAAGRARRARWDCRSTRPPTSSSGSAGTASSRETRRDGERGVTPAPGYAESMLYDVDIVSVPARPVVSLRRRGPLADIGASMRRLRELLAEAGLEARADDGAVLR